MIVSSDLARTRRR